jgi:alginate O-acetyltransferase complex protein AlgI
MVLFGLWHKATVLFLLWGCYHGVLLLVHRRIQQWQRRWNWEPPTALWTPLAWLATLLSIDLGWILFRATSVVQAGQMFSAVFSPASYVSHVLSGSLYGLVLALAVGYATVLLISDALERDAAEPAHSRLGLFAALARNRWYWIVPLYGLALIVVLLVTHGQDAGAAQFIYRQF